MLFSFSNRVQYFVKMILFMTSSLVFACAPIPLMLPRPRDYRNALIPAWLCVKMGHLLGASYELRGLENINRDVGGVVLINHQSAIDLIVLAKLWPVIGRATQVAKKAVLYWFPFGLACWLWGTLFINRDTSAQTAINKQANAITERKSKILFFPEGTRNQSDALLPLKKGSFHLAIQAQCSIQPIVVSRYTFLDSKAKIFGRGHSIIKILPVVETKGLKKTDVEALVSNVQKIMQENFEKLNDEMAANIHMK